MMANTIFEKWWMRWSIYTLLGIVFKFLLDVTYSLLYRNYLLFQPLEDYLPTILLSVVALELIHQLNNYLEKRITWEKNPYQRFFVQWSISVLIGILIVFGIRWLTKVIFSSFYYVRVLDEAIVLIMMTMVITAMILIVLGLFLLNKWRFSLAELERFKKENAESQFESLRSQINPHFLFNSLNTLSSLIYENQEKAESFIRELSDVYRYILENRGKELLTLREELAVAQSYIYLAQLRFDKNLIVRLAISSDYDTKNIAPLTLQLLVENAVKHNVISKRKPLFVDIFVEGKYLIVKNNLQKKVSKEYSSQIGLKNIQSRYAFLTKDKMEVLESQTEFIVKIPLIQSA